MSWKANNALVLQCLLPLFDVSRAQDLSEELELEFRLGTWLRDEKRFQAGVSHAFFKQMLFSLLKSQSWRIDNASYSTDWRDVESWPVTRDVYVDGSGNDVRHVFLDGVATMPAYQERVTRLSTATIKIAETPFDMRVCLKREARLAQQAYPQDDSTCTKHERRKSRCSFISTSKPFRVDMTCVVVSQACVPVWEIELEYTKERRFQTAIKDAQCLFYSVFRLMGHKEDECSVSFV